LAERTQAQVVPCIIEGNYRWFRSHTKVTVGTPYALKCPRELKKSEYARIEAGNASKRIACMLNKQAQIVNSPIEAEAVSLSE
jgi:hypothetical protein